jgi:hypothetical protein
MTKQRLNMLRALETNHTCRTVFHDLATPHRAYIFPAKQMSVQDGLGPASGPKFASEYSASIPWRLVSSFGMNSPTYNRRDIHGLSTRYLKQSHLKLKWHPKRTIHQPPPMIEKATNAQLGSTDTHRVRPVDHTQWTVSPLNESASLPAAASGRAASRLPGELAGPFHQLQGVRTAMAVNVLRTFEANLERTIKLCQPFGSAIEPRSPDPPRPQIRRFTQRIYCSASRSETKVQGHISKRRHSPAYH